MHRGTKRLKPAKNELTSLSGPPRVRQSGVELEKIFECGFMASDEAYV